MVVRACNTSYSGGRGRRIAWTQEAEVAVSRDRAIALQPGQQEWNSISKKKKITFSSKFRNNLLFGETKMYLKNNVSHHKFTKICQLFLQRMDSSYIRLKACTA